GGLLQVGPESAGSDPGPACYGLGSERPTVTDANVVLGRINAERPIGDGLERLDVEAARAAILTHVGRPLELDTMAAAEAVIRLANSHMAGAIRLVSVERGHDPRHFAAMPFGGSGALHAGALIREVGLSSALVPRYPGVTSALGCVIADLRHDFVHTVNVMLDDLDAAALDAEIVEAAAAGSRLVESAGIALAGIDCLIELDMLYLGQTHTVAVPLALEIRDGGSGVDAAKIKSAFEARYRQVYGRLLDGIAIRLLNLRLAVIGRRPKLDMAVLAPEGGSLEAARRHSRPIWIDGDWQEAPVFERLALPVGAAIAGPAVLEQPDATTFVDPGLVARVDAWGNLVLAAEES
ncbi:MAG: hydantoinase/oxoprolinase family protein, partial [Alphaproteobacteria bacterium]|nr:hydantoinase/oxoprolinase family protein [Alphaproteobacteria bacterium]